MSTPLHEKIRAIRETENLGRTNFEKETGVSRRTIENLENKGSEPKGGTLEAICKRWPEYTLWLMTDMVHIEAGQISPDIKRQSLSLNKAQKAG